MDAKTVYSSCDNAAAGGDTEVSDAQSVFANKINEDAFVTEEEELQNHIHGNLEEEQKQEGDEDAFATEGDVKKDSSIGNLEGEQKQVDDKGGRGANLLEALMTRDVWPVLNLLESYLPVEDSRKMMWVSKTTRQYHLESFFKRMDVISNGDPACWIVPGSKQNNCDQHPSFDHPWSECLSDELFLPPNLLQVKDLALAMETEDGMEVETVKVPYLNKAVPSSHILLCNDGKMVGYCKASRSRSLYLFQLDTLGGNPNWMVLISRLRRARDMILLASTSSVCYIAYKEVRIHLAMVKDGKVQRRQYGTNWHGRPLFLHYNEESLLFVHGDDDFVGVTAFATHSLKKQRNSSIELKRLKCAGRTLFAKILGGHKILLGRQISSGLELTECDIGGKIINSKIVSGYRYVRHLRLEEFTNGDGGLGKTSSTDGAEPKFMLAERIVEPLSDFWQEGVQETDIIVVAFPRSLSLFWRIQQAGLDDEELQCDSVIMELSSDLSGLALSESEEEANIGDIMEESEGEASSGDIMESSMDTE